MSGETTIHGLVGVYRSPEVVERLVPRLEELGVRRDELRIDEEGDVIASLQAEMREETAQAYVTPIGGLVAQKEHKESSLKLAPIFVLAGGAVGFLLSILPLFDAAWVWRAVWFTIAGCVAGGAVAGVAIPAVTSRNKYEPSAAQRGVVLRVPTWSERIERLMAEAEPIRLDRIGGEGYPLGTVTTEGDRNPADSGPKRFTENLAAEARKPPEQRER
jgi:hypothetical protein